MRKYGEAVRQAYIDYYADIQSAVKSGEIDTENAVDLSELGRYYVRTIASANDVADAIDEGMEYAEGEAELEKISGDIDEIMNRGLRSVLEKEAQLAEADAYLEDESFDESFEDAEDYNYMPEADDSAAFNYDANAEGEIADGEGTVYYDGGQGRILNENTEIETESVGRSAEETSVRTGESTGTQSGRRSFQQVLRGEGVKPVSAVSLGVNGGSSIASLYEISEGSSLYNELDLDKTTNYLKKHGMAKVRYVSGSIRFTGADGQTHSAEGVVLADGSMIISAGSKHTPAKIARHELFHAMFRGQTKIIDRMVNVLKEEYTDTAIQSILDQYTEKYASIYGDDSEAIFEEFLADAYAGINRFGSTDMDRVNLGFAQKYGEMVREAAAGVSAGNGNEVRYSAMYRHRAESLGDYYKFVRENKYNQAEINKSYYQITTDDGVEIDIPFDRLLHIDEGHELAEKDLVAIFDSIVTGNIEQASIGKRKYGAYDGIPLKAKIATPTGYAGIMLEVTNSGRTFVRTAFYDTESNINEWLKKDGFKALTALQKVEASGFLDNRLSMNSIYHSVMQSQEQNFSVSSDDTATADEKREAAAGVDAGNRNEVRYGILYPQFNADDIRENSLILQKMTSVIDLTGNEFPKSNISLKEQVLEFFDSLGNNIYSDTFGDVALVTNSWRSDYRHGLTTEKAISFAAIPQVIQNGVVIDTYKSKTNQYERIVVAAPITIANTPYVMGVMLQRDTAHQRLYLHDVITKNQEDGTEHKTRLIAADSGEIKTRGSNLLDISTILHRALNVKPKIADVTETQQFSLVPDDTATADEKREKKADEYSADTREYTANERAEGNGRVSENASEKVRYSEDDDYGLYDDDREETEEEIEERNQREFIENYIEDNGIPDNAADEAKAVANGEMRPGEVRNSMANSVAFDQLIAMYKEAKSMGFENILASRKITSKAVPKPMEVVSKVGGSTLNKMLGDDFQTVYKTLDIFKYIRKSEAQSLREAVSFLKAKTVQEAVNALSDPDRVWGSTELDAAMIIREIFEGVARKTGDMSDLYLIRVLPVLLFAEYSKRGPA